MKEVTRSVFDSFIDTVQQRERIVIDEIHASLFFYKLESGRVIAIDSPHRFEVNEKAYEQYTGKKL